MKSAWPIPGTAVATVLVLFPSTELAQERLGAISFFLGLAGGVAWQFVDPRDFVDRFAIWALVGSLIAVVLGLGVELDASACAGMVYVGVPSGALMSDWWARRRATRLAGPARNDIQHRTTPEEAPRA